MTFGGSQAKGVTQKCPAECPTRESCKSVQEEHLLRMSNKSVKQCLAVCYRTRARIQARRFHLDFCGWGQKKGSCWGVGKCTYSNRKPARDSSRTRAGDFKELPMQFKNQIFGFRRVPGMQQTSCLFLDCSKNQNKT